MFTEYENVVLDEGCSLKLIHQKVEAEEFVWQYHFHPEMELVCIPTGTGGRHVGQSMSRYENGDIILIGSNVPHSGFGLNASNPHEEIVLQFPEKPLETICNSLHELKLAGSKLLSRSKLGMSFHGSTKLKVTEMMKELLTTPPEDRYLKFLSIFKLLSRSDEYEILNQRAVPSKQLLKSRARLQSVFTYIENNYQSELAMSEVAELVGMTIPAFSTYFKRMMSMSFTDFVNQYRIQKACALLAEDNNVTEAAFGAGYSSVSYFNRVFKKIQGTSPSQYKKRIAALNH